MTKPITAPAVTMIRFPNTCPGFTADSTITRCLTPSGHPGCCVVRAFHHTAP